MTTLVTSRLVLRPARQSDLEPINRVLSDPTAMRYWSTPPHPDLATTQGWLDRMLIKGNGTTALIIERNGQVIGEAGGSTLPEVGLILHPDHWRQGIGREVMLAIINHIFATTDHSTLTADVDPRNAGSLGLLTGIGFVETHRADNTFCLNGEWCHSIYLALKRSNFAST